MKTKCFFIGLILCISQAAYSQNSFPADGNVTIGGDSGPTPLLIRKTPIELRASHITFGDPFAASGSISSKLTFAGWGIAHAGFAWSPQINGEGKLQLGFGGTENPALNSIAVTFKSNGNVGIGTTSPREKLSVNGNIRAREIKVETQNWPDYVFEEDYKQSSLAEIEAYIKKNKHLPEIPSAAEVKSNGVNLGEVSAMMLKKIEELTLLLIEKDKQLAEQKQQIQEVNKRLEVLEARRD